jgi:hypothetical protein
MPTETSPLLPKAGDHRDVPRHPVDPSGGLVPAGADAYQPNTESEAEEEEDENDGGDVERQTSQASDGRSRQFDGMPEVRKQMKWLFPAMGIGVRLYLRNYRVPS